MKKIAVMQPYFLPYLGYFQLIAATDIFVFFDDVNFINKGWINRNQILHQGKASLFTVPLTKASQNKKINEILLADYTKWSKDFLKTIEFNYKKAPFFPEIYTWLQQFLQMHEYKSIGDLATKSIESIAALLAIETAFLYSGEMDYQTSDDMQGDEKILSICKMLGAQQYINPINGQSLYDREKFNQQNIRLNFIKMDEIKYHQFDKETFVPYLSILDVMMFNGADGTKAVLDNYTLI